MDLAPEGASVKTIKAYTVGVNVVCYSQFSKRPPNESDEGRELKPGIVQVDSKPLKFTVDACVKYAYPHGHDGLLLIALDNKTTNQTLLRRVPDVENGGTRGGVHEGVSAERQYKRSYIRCIEGRGHPVVN